MIKATLVRSLEVRGVRGPSPGLTNSKQVTKDSISFEAQNVHRKLHNRQIADAVTSITEYA